MDVDQITALVEKIDELEAEKLKNGEVSEKDAHAMHDLVDFVKTELPAKGSNESKRRLIFHFAPLVLGAVKLISMVDFDLISTVFSAGAAVADVGAAVTGR